MFGLFGPPKVQCSVCGKKVPKYSESARDEMRRKHRLSSIREMAYQCRSCRAVVCYACSNKVTELPRRHAGMRGLAGMFIDVIQSIAARDGEEKGRRAMTELQVDLIDYDERMTCPKCGKKEVGFCD